MQPESNRNKDEQNRDQSIPETLLNRIEPYVGCLSSLREAWAQVSPPSNPLSQSYHSVYAPDFLIAANEKTGEKTTPTENSTTGGLSEDQKDWIKAVIINTFDIMQREVKEILESENLGIESLKDDTLRRSIVEPLDVTKIPFKIAWPGQFPKIDMASSEGDPSHVRKTPLSFDKFTFTQATEELASVLNHLRQSIRGLPLYPIYRTKYKYPIVTRQTSFGEILPQGSFDPFDQQMSFAEIEPLQRIRARRVEARFDIPPIVREKYESILKTRLLALQDIASRNQESVVELRLTGSPSASLLEWIRGAGPEDAGPVPGVTIVYELPLPSGSAVPFVLKESFTGRRTTQTVNPAGYDIADTGIILGLRRAIELGAKTGNLPFLTDLRPWEYSEDVRKLITEVPPKSISLQTLRELHTQYRHSLWQCLSKIPVVSTTAKVPEAEFTTREAFDVALKKAIQGIATHPKNPRPDVYFLSQDEVPIFLERYGEELFNLHRTEKHDRERRLSFEVQSALEQEQYFGPSFGYPLSLEVQLLDKIYDYRQYAKLAGRTDTEILEKSARDSKQKKPLGRPYSGIGIDLNKIKDDISSTPPIRHVVLKYVDSQTGKERQITSEQEIVNFSKTIHSLHARASWKAATVSQKEALKEATLTALQKKIEEMSLGIQLDSNKKSTPIDILEDVRAQAKRLKKATTENSDQTELRNKLSDLETEIELLTYCLAFEPTSLVAPRSFLLSLSGEAPSEYNVIRTPKIFENLRIIDSCMAKYIYAIGTSGTTRIARESLSRDGRVRLRPTHSQIAEGKTVWAAGELLVGTHDETFVSVSSWLKWLRRNADVVNGEKHRVLEINNLSGHYLPGYGSLKYARHKIIPPLEGQGFDGSKVRLINRLLTGVEFSLTSMYGFQE